MKAERPTLLKTQRILGVRFFDGTAAQAVELMCENGGLLVVPAAPALVNIQYDSGYRGALVQSDIAIADSGFMVLLWRILQRQAISRISGLAYFKRLVQLPRLRRSGEVFLVLPSESAAGKALSWFRASGFNIDAADCYVAPRYGAVVEDPILAELLGNRRPSQVIIGLGGGVQEKLGLYLKDVLNYRAAIHCIGASLGFLTGDQKPIPEWADRLYLGWFLRLARNPRLYARRFWVAHELPGLIAKYGERLPPLRKA